MKEELYCIGCGALLQTNDPQKRGYTPSATYKKAENGESVYCQRCFKLQHYNQLEKVSTSEDEFLAILNTLAEKEALIVNVIDLFDISGSIISGLNRFVGNNDVLLVANKMDLLPKSANKCRLQRWLVAELKRLGITVTDVLLTSAKKRHYIDELLDKIEDMRAGKDVYIVGTTNVGKSTLINRILQSTGIEGDWITTSQFPGTTLDLIKIPLDDETFLIDTPGIIHKSQMTSLLDLQELKQVVPADELKPRTYQLDPQQTLFVGGLARFDFVTGERMGVTNYFSKNLTIHRRKLDGSDAFYDQHCGELLTPPSGDTLSAFPALVRREFSIKEPTDIVISGLGWIKIPEACQIAIHTPRDTAVYLRQPML